MEILRVEILQGGNITGWKYYRVEILPVEILQGGNIASGNLWVEILPVEILRVEILQ